jgi:hypothetical protein
VPSEMICVSCRHVLHVPDVLRAPTFTCPCCLAELPNPNSAVAGDVAPSLEREVRRDTRRTGGCLLVLAVLGALGLGSGLLVSIPAVEGGGGASFILALLFLLLLVAGVGLAYARPNLVGPGFARILLGGLAVLGGLFAFSLVLALALIIFLLVSCSLGLWK